MIYHDILGVVYFDLQVKMKNPVVFYNGNIQNKLNMFPVWHFNIYMNPSLYSRILYTHYLVKKLNENELKPTSGWSLVGTYNFSENVCTAPTPSGITSSSRWFPLWWNNANLTRLISEKASDLLNQSVNITLVTDRTNFNSNL